MNLFGVMVGSQRAARHMAEHGGGAIVNTTSIGGINAGAGVMTYRATKAAVIHITRSIAIDLAAHGIRVNCVAPAHIPTEINATFDQSVIVRAMQPLQRRRARRATSRKRSLYLASDRAAQITGVVLPVDGGTTAGAPPRSIEGPHDDVPTGDRKRSDTDGSPRPASTPATTTSICTAVPPDVWESRLPRAHAERGPRVVDA